MRRGCSLVPFLLGLLGSGVALAGPVDTWGFGARAMGQGGGGTTIVDGPDAVFVNPAALTRQSAQQLFLGYGLHRADFREVPSVWWDTNQDGRLTADDPPLQVGVDPDRADGVHAALGRPIGKRFGLALGAFIPVDNLLRIRTIEPALPNYFLYDNRNHRFELSVGFGWEQLPGVSVGGAVEMLAQNRYGIQFSLDVPVTGADEGDALGDLVGPITMDVHEMTLDMAPSFAPVAGIHWDVGEIAPSAEGLMLAVVYRGAAGLPVDISVDVQANIRVEDVGDLEPIVVALLAPMTLDMFDHYVPERLTLGAGWQRERWEIYGEAYRTSWDKMRVNVSNVLTGEVQTQLLRLSDPNVYDGNAYRVTFRPTMGGRVGAATTFPPIPLKNGWDELTLELRGGWMWEPSPLVSQGRTSAFLDADRMAFTGGLGARHGEPFDLVGGPIGWDVFVQYHLVASGTLSTPEGDPPRAGAPVGGAPIPVGGRLWTAGAQWSVDF